MPRLVVTSGEPAGIGPDVLIQIAQNHQKAQLIAVADTNFLKTRAAELGAPLSVSEWQPSAPPEDHKPGHLWCLHTPLQTQVSAGVLSAKNASYVVEMLNSAAVACLDGTFDALVTAPVQKSIINDAGISFSGHTEFFQAKASVSRVVMMLASPTLRVALATTHLSLRDVPDAITKESLRETLSILHNDLKHKFDIERPKILVTGLNPHAGENGHLGREEIEIIQPVINDLKKEGLNLEGPLPADTLFTPKYLEQADAVLAMYHDQGLPVLKSQGFGESVNITLGLPFIRTSVDHGTALDLAGTGKADPSSMQTAIDIAIDMATSSQTQSVPAQ